MRGDTVFRVYGVHRGRADDVHLGTFATEPEALASIAALEAREQDGVNWARCHHDAGFVIRRAAVETDFEIPSLPKPRDRYVVRTTEAGGAHTWRRSNVEVLRRVGAASDVEKVCEYERNYRLLHTFEPFRQRGHDYALISRQYTRAAVVDLTSGEVIAEEPEPTPGGGFCPVGFYVPDWWDLNDGSIIPGSPNWTADDEWPTGELGFVWGCYWGDDLSWKVQYLDLSRIGEGVIMRDERFGYLELATRGYDPPWAHILRTDAGRSAPPSFIRPTRYDGRLRVGFDVELSFDLETGKLDERSRRTLNREPGAEWE